MPLVEYALTKVRIPADDNMLGGRWDAERFSHSTEILEALDDPDIEEVSVICATQQGKSRIALTWISHKIEHNPGPMLIAHPNLADAHNWSRLRFTAMLRVNPSLRRKISETRGRFNAKSEETNVVLTKTFPGGYLKIVGGHSARGLRSNPVPDAVVEELDTFRPSAGKEGDQLRLIERRMDAFPIHKLLIVTTPGLKASSRALQRYERSDKRVREVPCPHCDAFQTLDWDNLKWDKSAEGEHLTDTAHFVCVACQEQILPRHQLAMCRQGRWVKTRPDRKKRAGFWLWAAYTRDWRILAKEWIEAVADGHGAIVAFVNTVRAEGWEEPGDSPDWEMIAQRAEPLTSWTIPPQVYFLTLGADVQSDRIEVTIVGWGLYQETWVIAHDVLYGDTSTLYVWKELEDIILIPRPQEQTGLALQILSGCIDTGHEKDMVYAFCRKHDNMHAIKGSSVFQHPILSKPTKQDVRVDGKIEGDSLLLWTIGVSAIKTMVYRRLRIAHPGPHYIHFPFDLHESYYKQLTSETLLLDETHAAWETHGPNETLDCMNYNIAAAWIGQVYKIPWESVRQANPRPNQQIPDQPPPPEMMQLGQVQQPMQAPLPDQPIVGMGAGVRGMAQQLLRGE